MIQKCPSDLCALYSRRICLHFQRKIATRHSKVGAFIAQIKGGDRQNIIIVPLSTYLSADWEPSMIQMVSLSASK